MIPVSEPKLNANEIGDILPPNSFENEFGPSRPLRDFMSPEQLVKFTRDTARLKREMEREMSPLTGGKQS
jgi:hypothetical protein